MLPFIIFAVICAHSISLYERERWHLLDPLNFFWAGVITIFVLQPLSIGTQLVVLHGSWPVEKALLAALFLSCCAIFGYEQSFGDTLASKLPGSAPRLNHQRLYVLGWLTIALGVVGYFLVFYTVGGLNEFLSAGRGWAEPVRNLPVPAFLETLVKQATAVLPIGCLILLVRAQVFDLPIRSRILAWSLGGCMWYWFLYLGTRSRLIWFTMAMLAVLYLPRKKSPSLVTGVVVFVALLFLTSFQKHFRSQFTQLSVKITTEEPGEIWDTILPSALLSPEKRQVAPPSLGTEFNCVIAVVTLVPTSVPYNYGYGFLELFTRWVPRAVWQSKRWPHMESMQGVLEKGNLSDHRDETTGLLSGPAFTVVGYWYNAGGFVGLAIGGWLAGMLMRFLRGFMNAAATNQSFLLLYLPIMAVGFIDAASTPLYWVYFVPFTLVPMAIAIWICREPDGNAGRPLRRRLTSKKA